jgi:aldehyde dehydrogenase (NAD+)
MLDFDPAAESLPLGHFIDGAIVEERTGPIAVRRPSDGAAYADIPNAGTETVDCAVESALRTFRASDWATRAPRERAKVLHRLADLIDDRRIALARLEALGSTRPIAQAVGWDVPYLADTFRFFAELADKHGGEVAATAQNRLGLIVAEPYGVIAAIAPWNFPLVTAGWKLAPALAAGNAVVLKPSELTPLSALMLAQLAVEAGLPPGLFNVVQGDGPTTGEALCRHPAVGKISFTGSTATGAAIMAASAASGIKPMTLELGGKSPQLMFGDADTELAASCVARGILSNAGQVCVAGSRLIVQRARHDEMVERLSALMSQVAAGPTWRETSGFSPIVSQRQLARIEDIVGRSLAQGAEPVIGGRSMEGCNGGAFYAPTILARVTGETAAVREEIFGPVLTVQSFEDEEEGITLAGHPDYGLAAGIYTADLSRALRAMRRMEAGTVWINRYGRSEDFILPTGGFKRSGIGKDLGREAFEASRRHKSVLIDIGD